MKLLKKKENEKNILKIIRVLNFLRSYKLGFKRSEEL